MIDFNKTLDNIITKLESSGYFNNYEIHKTYQRNSIDELMSQVPTGDAIFVNFVQPLNAENENSAYPVGMELQFTICKKDDTKNQIPNQLINDYYMLLGCINIYNGYLVSQLTDRHSTTHNYMQYTYNYFGEIEIIQED